MVNMVFYVCAAAYSQTYNIAVKRCFFMNKTNYEALKDEMKAGHLKTSRLLIRNYHFSG